MRRTRRPHPSILCNDPVNHPGSLIFSQRIPAGMKLHLMAFCQLLQMFFLPVRSRRLLFCLIRKRERRKNLGLLRFIRPLKHLIQIPGRQRVIQSPMPALSMYAIAVTKQLQRLFLFRRQQFPRNFQRINTQTLK